MHMNFALGTAPAHRSRALGLALLMALGIGIAHAQFQGGQRLGGNAGGANSSGSRQYYGPGTVGEAIVTADPESRRVIVITDEETSEHINDVITSLDRPKPQVLIKVVFLEVTYRDGVDIGVEGGFREPISDSTTGVGANYFGLSSLGNAATSMVVNPLGQDARNFGLTPPGSGLYQIVSSDYQVTLRAIAEAGKLEVLSRPTILARNNQQAVITVGQSVPLITNVRFDTFGNAINSVTYQNVGIILRVTPFITSDGMVEMIVAPEISSLSEQSIPISTGASAPVINLRSADTVVVTPDGQTVIIGGLMQNDKTSTESKIPLLGDIPILGNLFKRTVKNEAKTELMIFLTPQIIADPTQLAGLTARERSKSELAPQAFTEDELNRFLDGLPESENGPGAKQPGQPSP